MSKKVIHIKNSFNLQELYNKMNVEEKSIVLKFNMKLLSLQNNYTIDKDRILYSGKSILKETDYFIATYKGLFFFNYNVLCKERPVIEYDINLNKLTTPYEIPIENLPNEAFCYRIYGSDMVLI